MLDEPLSNLDAQTRLQLRAELARLHSRLATTMVYVTHDQVEALTLGQRVAVMKDGVIQQVADPCVFTIIQPISSSPGSSAPRP